jgi:hypothetical protein
MHALASSAYEIALFYMSLPDAKLEVGGFSGGKIVDQQPVWKTAVAVTFGSANPRGA